MVIYGKQAVFESLNSPESISKVFINKELDKSQISKILRLIREHNIPFSLVPIQKLNSLTPENHQGIVAILSSIQFSKIEDFVIDNDESQLFLLLDGITDTRNLGAIIRSAAGANVKAVILPSSGNAQITGETVKTSAGSIFNIPICRVNHIKDAVYYLNDYDFQIIIADGNATRTISQFDLKISTAIIMGSEDKGVSRGVKKICRNFAKIPINDKVNSYNVSVAAGMFLYEAMRQRIKH